MLHLLTPCVCGGTNVRPGLHCGHCRLMQLCCALLHDLGEARSSHAPLDGIACDLARDYDLPLADVRHILGLDDETETSTP